MRKIPPKLRDEMSKDSYYKKCCITNLPGNIEWHHNLIFGGKQVNEKFCILPLNKEIHRNIVKYKEQCDWIMLNRATDEELKKYSKVINYLELKKKLNQKYGLYQNGNTGKIINE